MRSRNGGIFARAPCNRERSLPSPPRRLRSLLRIDGTLSGGFLLPCLPQRCLGVALGGLGLIELLRRHGSRKRSEEHTSELQSRQYLVCRLLLEKKKKKEQNLKHISSRP